MKQVTNIEVHLHDSRAAVSCDYEGARYHYWAELDLQPFRESANSRLGATFGGKIMIFKNPPAGTPHRGLGDFNTRYLMHDRGIGKIVFDAMSAAAPALLPEAMALRQAEIDARQAADAEGLRKKLIVDAAFDLFEALRLAAPYVEQSTAGGSAIVSRTIREALEKAGVKS